MTLKNYRVRLATGVVTTMQLDEKTAQDYRLTDADLASHRTAEAKQAGKPKNKARKPRNK